MSDIDDIVKDKMSRELKKVQHLHSRVSICEHLWSRSTADVLMSAYARKENRIGWDDKGVAKFREALKLDVQLTMVNMLKLIDTFPGTDMEELKQFNVEYVKMFADWSKKII